MKQGQPWHGEGELADDGFWSDVVKAYEDSIKEGVAYLSEDQLWEAAKERARYRYVIARRVDKAKRQGKPYEEVLAEEMAEAEKQRGQEFN